MTTITLQTFSGTHHEIGVQQGSAVRELLHRGLQQFPSFEAVKLMKPRLLPTSLFLALAKRRATKLLKNDIPFLILSDDEKASKQTFRHNAQSELTRALQNKKSMNYPIYDVAFGIKKLSI